MRLNLRLRTTRMSLWRSEEVRKTVRGTVFLTSATDATLPYADTQFIQLLGHAQTAIAAQVQPVLLADVRQDRHIAPLTLRWRAAPPCPQPTICHTQQAAQPAVRQDPAISGNELKPHGVWPSLGPMAFLPSMSREELSCLF